jgi:hypothetical protein
MAFILESPAALVNSPTEICPDQGAQSKLDGSFAAASGRSVRARFVAV